MKSLIFVVEDDEKIVKNIKFILELHNYDVITTSNGKEALKALSKTKIIPDIILCDILMPEMNGYDFFQEVSNNPLWSHIPFIFVSALSAPEDVRFGKMLGVDDYLIKPFDENDLIAIISGKLSRREKIKRANKKIIEFISLMELDMNNIDYQDTKNDAILLYIIWDENSGAILKKKYPEIIRLPLTLNELAQKLFQSIFDIYGNDNQYEAKGIVLNLEKIGRNCFLYIDLYSDDSVKGGERKYLLALIAPIISYYDRMKIKEILSELSEKINEKEEWNIINYWEKISYLLMKP